MEAAKDKHDIDLKTLLSGWTLDRHYDHFQKENLTINHLGIMKSKHVDKLFQNLPIGDQILFEHHLELRNMGKLYNNELPIISNSSSGGSQNNFSNRLTSRPTSRKSSPVHSAANIDNARDADLLVPRAQNVIGDSDGEATNDFTLLSSTSSSPIPKTVIATPRIVAAAPAASVARRSHVGSVSYQIPVAPPAPVKEPVLKQFASPSICRYDLRQILTETSGGQTIFNYYNKNQHLREEHRTTLLNVIARYIDASGNTLTLSESNQLEDQIVELFPTEKLEFYRTTNRGKLYNKVANMKRVYKKFNKELEEGPTKSLLTENQIKEEYVEEYNEEYVNDMRAKADFTGIFVEFWKSTQAMRLKTIDEMVDLKDILEKWPEYKEANIMEYISMDFYAKFPSATHFSQVFHDSIDKLEKLLFMKVSPASAGFKNLQHYKKASRESQYLLILWVLHQILPPHPHVAVDEHGVKRKKRFSILDSQNAGICIRSSLALIDKYLQEKKTSTPPMLLVVGELGLEIQEIYVYFEGIRYRMTSVVDAAELCMHLYFLFSIEFPEEAQLYYNFMQKYFLNIEPEVKNSKIYTTIADLNAY